MYFAYCHVLPFQQGGWANVGLESGVSVSAAVSSCFSAAVTVNVIFSFFLVEMGRGVHCRLMSLCFQLVTDTANTAKI